MVGHGVAVVVRLLIQKFESSRRWEEEVDSNIDERWSLLEMVTVWILIEGVWWAVDIVQTGSLLRGGGVRRVRLAGEGIIDSDEAKGFTDDLVAWSSSSGEPNRRRK